MERYAEIAQGYVHRIYGDWTAWRACQYDSKDNLHLVDEVYAPLIQRYYDLEKYLTLPDYSLYHDD